MKELRDFLDSLPGPKEPPKGSFYDVKHKRDGQPRSQNAREHGLHSKHHSFPRFLETNPTNPTPNTINPRHEFAFQVESLPL